MTQPEYPPGREPWRERRAGLSWDQIDDVLTEKTWIGTDETGRPYQFVWTTDAADAIWELLKPHSAWPDD
jgi:hypothetical protein